MNDQEIRLRCFELAIECFFKETQKLPISLETTTITPGTFIHLKSNIDELLEIAEKIYHFLYKAEIELMAKDELTWAEYQKKLQDINLQNKKVKLKV